MAFIAPLRRPRSLLVPGYRQLQDRLVFISLVAVYYGIFIWSYGALLEPWQAFWGFGRSELGVEYWILSWLMVLLPALWMPLELRRPSQLIFMCQYLLFFVPATLVLYSTDLPRLRPDEDAFMIRNAKGHPLDPTSRKGYLVTKIGIDATKPLSGYPETVRVPGVEKVNLEELGIG